VQIYYARFDRVVSASLEHEYLDLMLPGIRASILNYVRWQDRQATLFGKLLLLRALQINFQDTGIEMFKSLDATEDGKPFIPGGPEFNISHSENMVVLAITPDGPIGIDIEKIRVVNIDDFSQYVPEAANLPERYNVDQVHHHFFDCWTKKEAVVKAYGKGLLTSLEEIAVQEDMALVHKTVWFIKKILIDEQYCCHIATNQSPLNVTVECINLMQK